MSRSVLPLPTEVPVDLGADPARELARRELARAEYRAGEPGLLDRVGRWLLDRADDALGAVAGVSPGGVGGLLVVLLVIVLAVVLARRHFGRVARRAAAAGPLFDRAPRTADSHRAAADAAEAAGRFDEAVRERMRALVRGLEERDLVEVRPGRTAGEATRAAAVAVPSAASAVTEAARRFDETVYGGRSADADAATAVRRADDAVRRAPSAVRA